MSDSDAHEPLTVVLATPHAADVSPYWLDAFLGLEKPNKADGSAGWARISAIRLEVAVARNMLTTMFLEQTDATHLLFWDDDILPPPDGLMRLLEDNAPIVSGFYVSRQPPAQPVVYQRLPPLRKHLYQPVAPQHPGLFYADGVGAGFLLIRREVFERIPRPWFQFLCGRPRGENISEDFYFCEKAIKAGYKILVDGRVSCGHVGRYIYDDGDLNLAQSRLQTETPERLATESSPRA